MKRIHEQQVTRRNIQRERRVMEAILAIIAGLVAGEDILTGAQFEPLIRERLKKRGYVLETYPDPFPFSSSKSKVQGYRKGARKMEEQQCIVEGCEGVITEREERIQWHGEWRRVWVARCSECDWEDMRLLNEIQEPDND